MKNKLSNKDFNVSYGELKQLEPFNGVMYVRNEGEKSEWKPFPMIKVNVSLRSRFASFVRWLFGSFYSL